MFFVFLVVCFLLNFAVFYYIQSNSEKSTFICSDFDLMVQEYSSMPIEEAEQRLNEEYKAYEIFYIMNSTFDAQTDEEMNDILALINEYKETAPNSYMKAEKMSRDSEYDVNREYYIYTLLEQIKYIKSYPSFINEMYDRAEQQSSFSIFSDEDDFSYKNLYKTAKDYEHLNDVNLTMGNDISFVVASEYVITDLFLIALAFLICFYLFSQEKESGLYKLVRSSKHGRLKTIMLKFVAMFILISTITILFEFSNYVLSTFLYGEFDLGRMVQSVSDFRNCIFEVNLGMFCLLNVLIKIMAVLIISSVFALLFVTLSSYSFIYIVSIMMFGIQILFRIVSSNNTGLSYFKYINIFYLMDSKSLLGNYHNLNFFSVPVSVCFIDLMIFVAVFVVCIMSSILIFCKGTHNRKLQFKIKTKYFRIKGNVSILYSEFYKHLISNKMILVVGLVVLFGVFSCAGTVSYPYSDISDTSYKEYMEYLAGDITGEKEEYINQQIQYFETLNMRLSELDSDNTLSESTKAVIQNTINNINQTKGEAFNRVNEQYNRLTNLNSDEIKVKFIDSNLYPEFIFSPTREWNNIATMLVVLLISIPFIYTVEYKSGMINIIRSSKYGKLRLFACKLIVTFFVDIAVYVSIYLPYLIRFINTYGTGSFSTSIQCIDSYQDVSNGITVFHSFLLSTICYFAISLLAAAIIVFISTIIKNHMIAVIASTAVLLFPCVIVCPYSVIRVGAIFNCEYYLIYSIIIILISIIVSALCLIIAGAYFTNTKIGGGLIDKYANKKPKQNL